MNFRDRLHKSYQEALRRAQFEIRIDTTFSELSSFLGLPDAHSGQDRGQLRNVVRIESKTPPMEDDGLRVYDDEQLYK